MSRLFRVTYVKSDGSRHSEVRRAASSIDAVEALEREYQEDPLFCLVATPHQGEIACDLQ